MYICVSICNNVCIVYVNVIMCISMYVCMCMSCMKGGGRKHIFLEFFSSWSFRSYVRERERGGGDVFGHLCDPHSSHATWLLIKLSYIALGFSYIHICTYIDIGPRARIQIPDTHTSGEPPCVQNLIMLLVTHYCVTTCWSGGGGRIHMLHTSSTHPKAHHHDEHYWRNAM